MSRNSWLDLSEDFEIRINSYLIPVVLQAVHLWPSIIGPYVTSCLILCSIIYLTLSMFVVAQSCNVFLLTSQSGEYLEASVYVFV